MRQTISMPHDHQHQRRAITEWTADLELDEVEVNAGGPRDLSRQSKGPQALPA
jgi:hypothetical protein